MTFFYFLAAAVFGSTLGYLAFRATHAGGFRAGIAAKRREGERAKMAGLAVERGEAVAVLRQVCEEHGDNDWPDDLHLADVIEKHLWGHLEREGEAKKGLLNMNVDVYEVKSVECPYCDFPINVAIAALPGTQRGPSIGDYCLCVGCGKVCRFDEDGRIRKMTALEEEHVRNDPESRRVLDAWNAARGKAGGCNGGHRDGT